MPNGVEPAQSQSSGICIHDGLQFPWHEQASAQKICAGITSAVFQQTRSFRVNKMREPTTYEQPGKVAQSRNPPRNRQSTYTQRHLAKRWITAKKFISTQAGNRHFQSKFPGRFADEPGVEAIDRRLVHCFDDFRQIIAELLLGYDTCRMPCAIS